MQGPWGKAPTAAMPTMQKAPGDPRLSAAEPSPWSSGGSWEGAGGGGGGSHVKQGGAEMASLEAAEARIKARMAKQEASY